MVGGFISAVCDTRRIFFIYIVLKIKHLVSDMFFSYSVFISAVQY